MSNKFKVQINSEVYFGNQQIVGSNQGVFRQGFRRRVPLCEPSLSSDQLQFKNVIEEVP